MGITTSVIVRTLNEEKNIGQFCEAYSWATNILIADGGSSDKTIEYAKKYPNAHVRPYDVKIQLKNGLWRNPQGRHIDFLIDWAEQIGSDWIVFSDCDEYPNKHLIDAQKSIFETTDKKYIRVVKVFLYHRTRWFPALSSPYGKWYYTLWAWKPECKVRAYSDDRFGTGYAFPNTPKDAESYHDITPPPMCLLHNAWPDGQTTLKKLFFYRRSGEIPKMLHPLKFGKEIKPLEDWMK